MKETAERKEQCWWIRSALQLFAAVWENSSSLTFLRLFHYISCRMSHSWCRREFLLVHSLWVLMHCLDNTSRVNTMSGLTLKIWLDEFCLNGPLLLHCHFHSTCDVHALTELLRGGVSFSRRKIGDWALNLQEMHFFKKKLYSISFGRVNENSAVVPGGDWRLMSHTVWNRLCLVVLWNTDWSTVLRFT